MTPLSTVIATLVVLLVIQLARALHIEPVGGSPTPEWSTDHVRPRRRPQRSDPPLHTRLLRERHLMAPRDRNNIVPELPRKGCRFLSTIYMPSKRPCGPRLMAVGESMSRGGAKDLLAGG